MMPGNQDKDTLRYNIQKSCYQGNREYKEGEDRTTKGATSNEVALEDEEHAERGTTRKEGI